MGTNAARVVHQNPQLICPIDKYTGNKMALCCYVKKTRVARKGRPCSWTPRPCLASMRPLDPVRNLGDLRPISTETLPVNEKQKQKHHSCRLSQYNANSNPWPSPNRHQNTTNSTVQQYKLYPCAPDLRQGITFCPLDSHGAVLSAKKRFG